jgi:hypothetical protein
LTKGEILAELDAILSEYLNAKVSFGGKSYLDVSKGALQRTA